MLLLFIFFNNSPNKKQLISIIFGTWRAREVWYQYSMKKRSERRKHCALAVVRQSQKFSPRRRLLPGGTGSRGADSRYFFVIVPTRYYSLR